jgi:UDP-N-acetylmuramoyl-L-alanyl-D-glutamate--2,6-diaminopimelate ligase
MKSLQSILFGVALRKVIGSTDKQVVDIQIDSRKVISGSIFIAIVGVQVDGHSFINTAIENGASIIVCQVLPEIIVENITFVSP